MKLPLQPYRSLLMACETPLEHLSHAGSDDSRNRDAATVLSSRVVPTTETSQGGTQMAETPRRPGEGTSQEGRGEGTSYAERHP